MTPKVASLPLLAVVAFGLAPVVSAPKPGTPDERTSALELFRGDDRLRTRLTLAHKERPLSEVVATLEKQLNVRLTTTRETAHDRVTLFLDDRPAAEVLALIADQFDFHWSGDRTIYRLEQLPSAQRREAELRSRYLQAQLDRSLALVQHVEHLLLQDPWQRDKREEEVALALRSPEIMPAEAAALFIERQAFSELRSLGARVMVPYFRQFVTPAHLLRLRQERDVRFSTEDRTLSPEFIATIDKRSISGRASLADDDPPTEFKVQFEEAINHFPSLAASYQPCWALSMALPNGTPRLRRSEFWTAAAPPLPISPALDLPEDPLWKREVTLALPDERAGEDPADLTRYRRQRLVSLGDLAEALHQQTGTEVLADGFARTQFPASEFTLRRRVEQVLERLAGQRYKARKEGNLLRLRNELFFLNRPKEVPEALLAPWRRQVNAEGRVTLDHLASLAARVDEPRLQGLAQWWRGYFPSGPAANRDFADRLWKYRRDLRFWASLSAVQRQAVQNGASLSFPQMTNVQRQLLLTALKPGSEDNTWTLLVSKITPAQWPALLFQLDQHSVQEQSYRLNLPKGGATQTTYRLHPAEPSDIPEGAVPIGQPYTVDEAVLLYSLAEAVNPLRRSVIPLRRPEPN